MICMDEQPIQLIKERRKPISSSPGKPLSYDYEYERNPAAVNFLFTQTLGGWRKVNTEELQNTV